MGLVLQKLLTAVTTFVCFSFIPFLWWYIYHRKQVGFFEWVGFIKPKLKRSPWSLVVFLVVYYLFYTLDIKALLDPESIDAMDSSSTVAANAYKGLGAAAILPCLIECFIVNGVSEELFYRGFLTKRLGARLGMNTGIALQAVCFGLMHNLLFLAGGTDVSAQMHLALFLVSGFGGLMLALLNERIFNGSIIPSIFLHGLGNFISAISGAFS